MNNLIKHITLYFALIVICVSCALVYNIPSLSDYKIFPFRVIKNSPDSIFYFPKADTMLHPGENIFVNNDILMPNVVSLDDYIKGSKTAAFIIIREDTIIYEKYTGKYKQSSISNIFSVTKVFVTTLIGIAIDEGIIKSVDQSITDYIPEFKEIEGFDQITIRHLLSHTSGIKFSTVRYNPFADNARYYYGRNLRKLVFNSKLERSPGEAINYGSVNVQLLALILEKASGTTLSNYLQAKIWQKIGMQYEATWSLDNKRKTCIEKGFSGLNCTAIDLAKLGRLYLNDGVWQNQQILSSRFISEAVKRDTICGSYWNFQYNFRLEPKQYECYYSRGLFGQLIYVYPKKQVIMVRIGETDLNYNPQFMNLNLLQIIDQI